MQIKYFLFPGFLAASLLACAPATKYETDGAFSSEPAFSQVVRPASATQTKPVTPNTKPETTTPTTPVLTQPETPATIATPVTSATTPISPATPAEPEVTQEVVVGEPITTTSGGGVGVNILPESYTATAGNASYIDDTGKQLIDNQVGSNVFNAKVLGTAGYEWVGWARKNVLMTFKFAKERKLTLVKIGFNFNTSAGIGLPKAVTINGKLVALKGTELKRNSRGFLIFGVSLSTNQITIELERNPLRQWIFVDEVKFVGVQDTSL